MNNPSQLRTLPSRTLPLKQIPQNIHDIIRKEQVRLEFEEDKKLKIESVVYAIIKDWAEKRISLSDCLVTSGN